MVAAKGITLKSSDDTTLRGYSGELMTRCSNSLMIKSLDIQFRSLWAGT